MKPALTSKTYRDFSKQRDKALEAYHLKVQKEVSQLLTGAIIEVDRLISHFWPIIESHGFFQRNGNIFAQRMERLIEQKFKDAIVPICLKLIEAKRTTFVVTYAAEGQALALTLKRPVSAQLRRIELKQVDMNQLMDRVGLTLDQLASKVVFALRQAKVQEEDISDARERVQRVLPKIKKSARVPDALKTPRLKEADDFGRLGNKDIRVTTGFVDDELWNETVRQFADEFKPKWRDYDTVFDIPDEHGDLEEWYGWQIEQEVTNDFVQQVRDGKVDLANHNGIHDFVWISVVGKNTCDSCLWRDGLTTDEIKEQLNSRHKDDEYPDGLSPPLHFSCFCDVAPMSDDIQEQVPDSNAKQFETWLNS